MTFALGILKSYISVNDNRTESFDILSIPVDFIASFTLHQFWKATSKEMRLMEGMHFAKNMAILTELIYIANS